MALRTPSISFSITSACGPLAIALGSLPLASACAWTRQSTTAHTRTRTAACTHTPAHTHTHTQLTYMLDVGVGEALAILQRRDHVRSLELEPHIVLVRRTVLHTTVNHLSHTHHRTRTRGKHAHTHTHTITQSKRDGTSCRMLR
jgi:hypothetical protein